MENTTAHPWNAAALTTASTPPASPARRSRALGAARAAVALPPMALVGTLLWLIWARSSALPYWDEWFTVDLVRRMDAGTIGWRDLWAFHNEHRIVVPRIVNLLTIHLTAWNRPAAMTINLIVAGCTLGLLVSTLRHTHRSPAATWAYVAPFSLLIFSLGQYENWLEPFQIAFIATAFGVALCVRGLATARTSGAWYGVALAGAIVASLSSLGGLAVWLAFLPAACALGRRKGALWLATALAIGVPYLQGMPAQGAIATPLTARLAYTLTYLGMPAAYPFPGLARVLTVIGAAMFALALLSCRVARGEWRVPLGWLGLAAHGVACALMTSLGRNTSSGFVPSRYQIFAAEWWIGIVAIAGLGFLELRRLAHRPTRPRRLIALVGALQGLALVLCCAGFVLSSVGSLDPALHFQVAQRANQECLRVPSSATEGCLRLYYPGADWAAEHLPERADYLRRARLALYR